MYYSEEKGYPIAEALVKSLYGVDPVNDVETARKIGIYDLTDVPEGYSVSHYEKEDENTYNSIPHCVTIEEMQMVKIIRKMESTFGNFRQRFGLGSTPEEPQEIDGYFPLYTSELESNLASSDGSSQIQQVNGVDYFMPNAGVPLFDGDYPG